MKNYLLMNASLVVGMFSRNMFGRTFFLKQIVLMKRTKIIRKRKHIYICF